MSLRPELKKRLQELEQRYDALERQMADPAVISDGEVYQKVGKEHSDLSELVATFREHQQLEREEAENRELMKDSDPEMRELAEAEVAAAEERLPELEEQLRVLLLPKDPNDDKNIILEIRAGTGGEEAALFAADLFRMYSRFAENMRWKVDIVDAHETDGGGFKEIVAEINGKGAYSQLKFESGVHRVQRVPATESQGRIHTSAVTVAILPEAEDVDIEVRAEDLRIDTYRSSGAGGQHVNVTDSAVRITHVPTGLVVSCQDERSQHKNKAKAMKVLKARLYEKMCQEQAAQEAAARKSMVGSGDRSERIRTYNFPQNRVSDHRIGLTIYHLDQVLQGDLSELIPPLVANFQAEALKSQGGL